MERWGSERSYQGGLGYYSGPGAVTDAAGSNEVNNITLKQNSKTAHTSSVAFDVGHGKDDMVADISLVDDMDDASRNKHLILHIYQLSEYGSPSMLVEKDLGAVSLPYTINTLNRWEPDAFMFLLVTWHCFCYDSNGFFFPGAH